LININIGLTDITISREKIQTNDDIIDLEGMNKISSTDLDSSILYSIDHFEKDFFKEDKILSSIRYKINEEPCKIEDNDLKESLNFIEENINSYKESIENNDSEDNDDDDIEDNDDDEENEDFIKLYNGNFLLACPTIIDSKESSNISAYWIIKKDKDKLVYKVNLSFDAYQDTKKKSLKKESEITQPSLNLFYVDEIKWK